jgi:hypothetical protein
MDHAGETLSTALIVKFRQGKLQDRKRDENPDHSILNGGRKRHDLSFEWHGPTGKVNNKNNRELTYPRKSEKAAPGGFFFVCVCRI